ncbi:MAG TPA: sigma-70 family RNA polymerase sigma factor [Candidatus Krumholzibacteria bacterium]|nr:sigma-70 family RNA polymerase sigma factor [Candidatus Krumholzibacteria bacterium]
MAEPEPNMSDVVDRERSRLRSFIRRRVPDPADAEDILQDVFSRLIEANEMLVPIEHVTGWLYRVARNRIADLFRARRPERFSEIAAGDDELAFEELLPSPDDGPDAVLERQLLLEALEVAINELPREQRDVFVAHELEGKSFKQISDVTGVSVNTLLSRKHYAVLRLREALQSVHDEWAE